MIPPFASSIGISQSRNQFSLRHLILVDIVDTEGVEKAQSCDLMPSNSDPGLK